MWLNRVNQWVEQRALGALTDAYQRAMKIKAIEEKHFNGQKISPETPVGKSTYDYFQSILERELLQIRLDLGQVKVSNFFNASAQNEREAEFLQILSEIEAIIGKYRELEIPSSIAPVSTLNQPTPETEPNNALGLSLPNTSESRLLFELPKRLTPEYEQQVIQQLRGLRQQRSISLRYLLLLIFIPLLVQFLSKTLIFSPVLDRFKVNLAKPAQVYISQEIGEKFLEKFARQKETYEIKTLLGVAPELEPEQARNYWKEQARELFKEAGYESQNGLANLLADFTGLGAFATIVYFGRRQFTMMRQYLSRSFLGLNDVTKVFIFILLTDMFVGFHSPEGWDVILGGAFGHFGFPENRTFNNLFIATIPVIMDSFFKLLIFNYLTRKSPAAVAILEKMNQ